jgi:methylmalonyl-CoA mutase cobalamin-binding subunit
VAFFQGLIDTKNAATVIPGEFFSTGHDYRADLASFVRAAFGFEAITPAQMDAIEERLRASELARSEGIALGKLQTA